MLLRLENQPSRAWEEEDDFGAWMVVQRKTARNHYKVQGRPPRKNGFDAMNKTSRVPRAHRDLVSGSRFDTLENVEDIEAPVQPANDDRPHPMRSGGETNNSVDQLESSHRPPS